MRGENQIWLTRGKGIGLKKEELLADYYGKEVDGKLRGILGNNRTEMYLV